MVKLAEPRRRQRYNLTPRGKALYEDEHRFGTKMLEKMGWSKGKGLGANEDGSAEFVRVRYKHDAEGLGYEARDDQWTQHEQSFNGLLQTLNGNSDDGAAVSKSGDEQSDVEMPTVGFGFAQTAEVKTKKPLKHAISGQSLEEKSKNSRARVHYKKFTRGKDLAQYSEKDLANIFGKKSLDEPQADCLTNVEENVKIEEKTDNFRCSNLSVDDYFQQKLKALKKQRLQPQNVEKILNANATGTKKIKKSKKRNRNSGESETVDKLTTEIEQPVEEPVVKKKNRKELSEKIQMEESAEKKKNKKHKQALHLNKQAKQKKTFQTELLRTKEIIDSESVETNTMESKQNKQKEEQEDLKPELLNVECAKKMKKKSKQNKKKDEQASETGLEKGESKNSIKVESKNWQKKIQHVECNVESEAKNEEKIREKEEAAMLVEKKSKKERLKNEAEDTGNKQEIQEENVQDTDTKKIINDQSEYMITKVTSKYPLVEKMKKYYMGYKTYEMKAVGAEKFQFVDVEAFKGCNLKDIKGYGIDDDVKIKIVKNEKDDEKILKLWSSTFDEKEFKQNSGNTYSDYEKQVRDARARQEKPARFKVHQYKRKDAFKTLNI